MNYKIKVNQVKKEESNLKGFATVVFGEKFKITNIAILNGKNGLYVQMPRYRTNELDENGKNIYRDFCNPTTKEFREELYGNILETYESTDFEEMYVGYRKGDTPAKMEYETLVTPFEREGSAIRGLARIFFEDSFIVNNVSVLSGKDTEFVAMPSYRTNQKDKDGRSVYQDVCYPVTKEFREELYGNVLQQYRKVKNKGVEEKVNEPKKEENEKKTEKKQGDKSLKTSRETKKSEAKEDLSDTPLKR